MTTPRVPTAAAGALEGRPDSRLSPVWYRFLADVERAIPRTGEATFSAGTTVTVSLTPNEASADYKVHIEPSENNTFWISGKALDEFTINAANTSSTTVGWTIVRT